MHVHVHVRVIYLMRIFQSFFLFFVLLLPFEFENLSIQKLFLFFILQKQILNLDEISMNQLVHHTEYQQQVHSHPCNLFIDREFQNFYSFVEKNWFLPSIQFVFQ